MAMADGPPAVVTAFLRRLFLCNLAGRHGAQAKNARRDSAVPDIALPQQAHLCAKPLSVQNDVSNSAQRSYPERTAITPFASARPRKAAAREPALPARNRPAAPPAAPRCRTSARAIAAESPAGP